MALSRKRHLQLIIAILVGTALLCAAIAIGFAMTRNTSSSQQKSTASASSSTSKTQPSQTVSPSSDPTTTSTTPTPSPTPTREPVDCTKEKCVALTFDDGPGPKTPELLDILAKEKVPATFMLVGRAVNTYPDTVAREVREGHVLANHTWSHPQLTKISDSKINKEITSTLDAIKKAVPNAEVNLTRPPYGAFNSRVTAALKSLKQSVILWDVDTLDWKNRNPQSVLEQVKKQTKAGSIILMHDIHPTTIQAVPDIIKHLRSQGYTLVTVPELYGGTMTPGKVYFDQNMVR